MLIYKKDDATKIISENSKLISILEKDGWKLSSKQDSAEEVVKKEKSSKQKV